jgi:ADP-heptose:LPS heptosyltransferase
VAAGSVLIIGHLKLGDVVQIFPAAAALKRSRPVVRIWLLGQKSPVRLAVRSPLFEGVFVADFPASFPSLGAVNAWAAAIAERLPIREWEGIVNLSHSLLGARLTDLLRAQWKSGMLLREDGTQILAGNAERLLFGSVAARRLSRLHLCDIYTLMVQADRQAELPLIRATSEEIRQVRQILSSHGWDAQTPLAAFQLGSGGPQKIWPVEYFVQVGQQLSRIHGITPVLIGSDDEKPLARAYFDQGSGEAFDLVGELPAELLPAFFRVVRFLITPDTGPAHIAALSGCRVIGLYFATAWVHETGPYGDGHLVWQVEMPCAPCFARTVCAERPCSRMITPDMVLWGLARAGLLGHEGATSAAPPREVESVRLYQSFRSEGGYQRYRPIYPDGKTGEDILAESTSDAALEIVARGLRSKTELPSGTVLRGVSQDDPGFDGATGLWELSRIARSASKECAQIRRALLVGRPYREVQRLNGKLQALDAQVSRIGDRAGLVGAYLREALRLLPGDSLSQLAAEAEEVYAAASAMAASAAKRLAAARAGAESTRVEDNDDDVGKGSPEREHAAVEPVSDPAG